MLQGLDMATGELRIVVKVVHDDTFAARIGIFGQYELADDQQVVTRPSTGRQNGANAFMTSGMACMMISPSPFQSPIQSHNRQEHANCSAVSILPYLSITM